MSGNCWWGDTSGNSSHTGSLIIFPQFCLKETYSPPKSSSPLQPSLKFNELPLYIIQQSGQFYWHNCIKYWSPYHSKMRSPVRSNSTVGITLVINFKKINRAKWEFTFCPFSLIESDMVFRTLACLQGWTVGIIVFSINGNFSMVRVLSKYSFWMSCLMSSLLTGFPLKSVALKNILGVWQYSSYTMYMVQYLKSSSFTSSYFVYLE